MLLSLYLLMACEARITAEENSTEQQTSASILKSKKTLKMVEQTTFPVDEWQQGKLVFIKLEGGFYGIVTPTGEKLLPLNLAKSYQQAGATVRFKAKKSDLSTIQQWGTPITLVTIELLAQDKDKIINANH